ncbi:MAG: Fic family protein [Clostridiales bacterium]|jgi:Fic family protein|nr:Fic family protein [Clostridiales bacterium]
MSERQKYIGIIAQVAENFNKMCGMRPIPEDVARRYYDDFSIMNCHNSTAIEGNSFTYDETRLILKEGVVFANHSLGEHIELTGYRSGYWLVYDSVKGGADISKDFIRQIHGVTMPGFTHSGGYRNIEVYVGDGFSNKVTYRPPSCAAVPRLMADYVSAVNADLKAFENIKTTGECDFFELFHALSKHHCEFERIHPFVDGNGRVGRLLLNTELIKIGLLPVDIRYEEKERYYAALKNYDTKVRYAGRPQSPTESMAKLLAASQLRSMELWNRMFAAYADGIDR